MYIFTIRIYIQDLLNFYIDIRWKYPRFLVLHWVTSVVRLLGVINELLLIYHFITNVKILINIT